MSPQQFFRLFVYADWAMCAVGLAALSTCIGLCLYAAFPKNRGRRRQVLSWALIGFLVFATFFWMVQASVMVAWFNREWTPLRLVLFASPAIAMLIGLIASIVCGTRAILRQNGEPRTRAVLKSLLGIVIFGVGLAPHTVTTLQPILSVEDHYNRPGTLTHVGEPVPDFELAGLDGVPLRSADLRGKVTVMAFFAASCGACQQELPHLQAVWDQFSNKSDFRMLVIGREESDDSVKAFQREHAFTFPVAADPDGSVYKKFASLYIPRTYLISRQGTIIYQWTGAYEEEIAKLKRRLDKELAKQN